MPSMALTECALLSCMIMPPWREAEFSNAREEDVRPAQLTGHEPRFAVSATEIVVSTIGVRLQDTLPSCEMLVGKVCCAILGEPEERCGGAPPFQGRSSRT